MKKTSQDGLGSPHVTHPTDRGVDAHIELTSPTVSIVHLVSALLHEAHVAHASDIHIEPFEEVVKVRFRIDGFLQDRLHIQKMIHGEVISRIKVIAGLRTDEHQTPQDGRFRSVVAGNPMDVRVSIAPTYFGENAVLRLLTDKQESLSLENLGFNTHDREKIEKALRKPSGMILSTGPTGSGKTTTLYAMMKQLSSPEISIVTIEDPIEYAIEGISQIQVNPRTGISFAHGLRSILRQDPNVIMVGEIRDAETAGIAVNSALTGHLLLSTIHTSDAATTLPRLLDMKIEPFLVASTVTIAIGQRLLRTICGVCKDEEKATETLVKRIRFIHDISEVKVGQVFYKGRGCDSCKGTGYRGRSSVNEVMVMNDALRDAVQRKASSVEMKSIAVKSGMTTMLEDGITKARNGHTTLEEVLRVIDE